MGQPKGVPVQWDRLVFSKLNISTVLHSMPISCIYKVWAWRWDHSACPGVLSRWKRIRMKFCVHPGRFQVKDISAQGHSSWQGEPWPAAHHLASAAFFQGWWSSSWDHEHSPSSQALIPTPRNGQYIAMRVPPIPQKRRTSHSTDDDRILLGEACLKQGSVALNCIPQCVWLWANSWSPCKVSYKVLQTSGLV